MYTLQLRKQVVKFINSRTPKERKIIAEAFEELRTNPYHNTLDIKKLRGTDQKYRLRIGDYRFLYALYQEQVLVYVYKAGNRGDIY